MPEYRIEWELTVRSRRKNGAATVRAKTMGTAARRALRIAQAQNPYAHAPASLRIRAIRNYRDQGQGAKKKEPNC